MADLSKKLEDDAKRAVTQWKLPKMENVLKGIISDHYSWMWTPSSLLILAASYYSLKIEERWMPTDLVLPVGLWLPSFFLYWTISGMFLILDEVTKEGGKTFVKQSKVPLSRMAAVVFKNHVLTLILAPCIVQYLYRLAGTTPITTDQETLGWLVLSVFICGGVFEIVFWSCHYLEHLSPTLYRRFHLLHHTTKSDVAISGYYMTFADFCGEGLVPMLFCVAAAAAFNLSSVAVMHQVMLNVVYAATVHSGWSIPGFPDPANHWIHHTKVAPRGQGINYGTHFDIMDIVMDTKQEYSDLIKK